MNILVAMPVYDGKIPAEVARALLNEKTVAHLLGDDLVVEFLPGCSHPGMGRNQLAKAFLESANDRLVFLDSDVTWEPGELCKIAHYPVEFCGGAYRFKQAIENYPVGWLPDPDRKGIGMNQYGLLDVDALPGGFMSLSRSVFEKFKAAYPGRTFSHRGNELYAYFEMPYKPGHLWGEDGMFCKMWRDLGGQIWLDPEITLTHWDFAPVPYKGNIGQWIKKNTPKTALPIHEPVFECGMDDDELSEVLKERAS